MQRRDKAMKTGAKRERSGAAHRQMPCWDDAWLSLTVFSVVEQSVGAQQAT